MTGPPDPKPLELAVRDRPAENAEAPPDRPYPDVDPPGVPASSRWPRRLGWAVLLAALVVGAVFAGPRLLQQLRSHLPAGRGPLADVRNPADAPILEIHSRPEGALVKIAGKTVGQTPLFTQNDYPDREIPLELTLPGHRRWRGTFRGGEKAAVQVRLEKK